MTFRLFLALMVALAVAMHGAGGAPQRIENVASYRLPYGYFGWTVPVRSRAPSVGSSRASSGRSLTNTFPFNAQDGEEHHGHHGEHHEWLLIPTSFWAGNSWTVEKSLLETLSGAACPQIDLLIFVGWILKWTWKNGNGHVTELFIIVWRIEIIRNNWNTNELLAFEELHNIEWHAAIKLSLLCDISHLSCGCGMALIYMCWHCWDSIGAFVTTNKSRINMFHCIRLYRNLPTCIYRQSNLISFRTVWTHHTRWLPDCSLF